MPRPSTRLILVLSAMLTVVISPLRVRAAEDEEEATPPPAPTREQQEQGRFFEARVRPVLVEHCSRCHGAEKPKAGLRVDSREALLEGGESGPAIVPGKPEDSALIAAVRHEGPKMPPKTKLDAPQVEALTRWVRMGAPWPGAGAARAPGSSTIRKGPFRIHDEDRDHWAFRPLRRPETPAAGDRATANPIDAFLLAGRVAKGLQPNPPAGKVALIRRASYDLTGLPPTLEEVAAFLADESPQAYEALVDRLLASPRYGEKWARHWLDLVRFAETNSYERDGVKPNAWRYRDYVIRAFNDDKPYSRFVREQLAGDELPDRDFDSLIATGYYRLGIWDDEPSDREQARYDGFDDVIATTGQVFLGLTVDCARCHDHKLDPIPQKDYYRLLSFFRNVNHYRNGAPNAEGVSTDLVPILDDAGRLEFERQARARERERRVTQAAVDAIEANFRARSEQARAAEKPDLDGLTYRFYRDTWERLPDFSAIKPESTGDLPSNHFDLGPRTRDDAFGFVFEGTLVVPSTGRYTFHLDSDDGSRLTLDGRKVVEYDGVHDLGHEHSDSLDLVEGRLPIRLEYFQQSSALGLSVAWSGPGFVRRPLSARTPVGTAKPDFASRIRERGAEVLGAETFRHYNELRRLLKEAASRKVPTEMALCVTEAGPTAPETTVLLRGNPASKGDVVEPAFLEVLGGQVAAIPTPLPGATTTGRRSVLADWIASGDNPLTARVMANRIWQYHFGRGIVRSPNNFGRMGDKPTHPELLNWLASELVANGWRLKPLHRLIMTSDAYKMSSTGEPGALAKDPTNDLFWRFDMRRLDAEEVRDSILAVSGSLRLKMYGSGIYPEIPAEVLAGQSVPGSGWGQSPPEEEFRRSIYIHAKRSLMTPILESFDAAETDRSTPSRFSTTQPTQALAMLNGRFLARQADALAARLRRETGDDVSRQVGHALQLVTSRQPDPAEVRRGIDLIEALKARDGLSSDEALRAFCLVALNLNEFLYLD